VLLVATPSLRARPNIRQPARHTFTGTATEFRRQIQPRRTVEINSSDLQVLYRLPSGEWRFYNCKLPNNHFYVCATCQYH